MSQSEDMAAINTYMVNTATKSPDAKSLQEEWKQWYPSLGWFDSNMNPNIYDQARNKRTAFNAANKTPENPTGLKTEDVESKGAAVSRAIGRVVAAVVSPSTVPVSASSSLGAHPTIKQGSGTGKLIAHRPAVIEWQTIIGAKADGNFGPGTDTITKKWQTDHKLTGDGVVGPKSWSVALNVPVTPNAVSVPVNDAAAFITAQKVVPPVTFPRPSVITPAKAAAALPSPPVPVVTPPKTPAKIITTVAKAGSKIKTAVVTEAGMFSNLPTWAKIWGGLTLATGVIFGLKAVSNHMGKRV